MTKICEKLWPLRMYKFFKGAWNFFSQSVRETITTKIYEENIVKIISMIYLFKKFLAIFVSWVSCLWISFMCRLPAFYWTYVDILKDLKFDIKKKGKTKNKTYFCLKFDEEKFVRLKILFDFFYLNTFYKIHLELGSSHRLQRKNCF